MRAPMRRTTADNSGWNDRFRGTIVFRAGCRSWQQNPSNRKSRSPRSLQSRRQKSRRKRRSKIRRPAIRMKTVRWSTQFRRTAMRRGCEVSPAIRIDILRPGCRFLNSSKRAENVDGTPPSSRAIEPRSAAKRDAEFCVHAACDPGAVRCHRRADKTRSEPTYSTLARSSLLV